MAPEGAGAARRTRRLRREDAVAVLTLLLAVVAALLFVGVVRHLPPLGTGLTVPFWLLATLFTTAEVMWVTVRVRRAAHRVSLSEIPLVVGLAAASPTSLLAARLIGAGIGLLFSPGQRGMKLVFNLALMTTEACIAALAFSFLLGGATPSSPRGWLAAGVAVLLATSVTTTLITAAIGLHADPSEWRRLPSSLAEQAFPAVTNTCISLVALLAVNQNAYAGVLLLVVAGIAHVAHQKYVAQSESHTRVERLYEFTRALGRRVETDDVITTVLGQARNELRADVAELWLTTTGTSTATRWRLDDDGVHSASIELMASEWWAAARSGSPVLRRAAHRGDVPAATPDDTVVDGMAVPLVLDERHLAVLTVSDSLVDVETFQPHDLRLFEAMANHAGVALANSRLMDRLRGKAAEEQYNARHDSLTGLPNRRDFTTRLQDALATRAAPLTAILLLDLDEFKQINDTLGHDTGDRLLCELGSRLHSQMDRRAVVARLGGDEFAVLMADASDLDQVRLLAEDVLAAIEAPCVIDQLNLHVRASMGIALAPHHGDEARTLLRRADVAMYAAKTGHSRVAVYDPHLDPNSHRKLALLDSLRSAVENHQLSVVYQPKVCPREHRVVGVEALARWDHPELGRVGPDEFIPLAEHSGLIRPLTLSVLETALRQCAHWRSAGHDLSVAVNLSARSLLDTDLPGDVARLLSQTRVPAAALTLEITETSIMADPAHCATLLDAIAALGVRLSIDDFGTGYSSFAYLQRLPVSEVKIDRSFVMGLTSRPGDRSIVRAIVNLGHELGLRVVAEGVEDEATLAFLRAHGCDLAQGYLFGRPAPANQIAPLLADGWMAVLLESRVG